MGKRTSSEEQAGGERAADGAGEPVSERKPGPFGGLTASEAALRRAASAREKRAAREKAADEERLTARQRLATALSLELTTDDWRAVVRAAVKGGKVADLARMFDQAFGKSAPEEAEVQSDATKDYASLTRAQRAALIAKVLEEEEEQRTPRGLEADPRGDDGDGPPAGALPPAR